MMNSQIDILSLIEGNLLFLCHWLQNRLKLQRSNVQRSNEQKKEKEMKADIEKKEFFFKKKLEKH